MRSATKDHACYGDLIRRRLHSCSPGGIKVENLPPWLMDFQSRLVEWSLWMGRSALFADCGLGKTPMQLAWCDALVRHCNRPALIMTPLAVGPQTVRESVKFGVSAERIRDGVCRGEAKVYVTNYEQIHKFDPSMFCAVACDESSCIKDAKTARKAAVVDFLRSVPYRLLCTATAAPNDYWELGTSSEALGLLGFRDMITMFFKMEQSKGGKAWGRTKYRFRGHAEEPFWNWVSSWSRSIQKPSDIGFDDSRFVLPRLIENEIVVDTKKARPGFLFPVAARDMREERQERRHSMTERCERAADIAHSCGGYTAMWCELNDEGDWLHKNVKDCVQVSGSMKDEAKEEAFEAFSTGQAKRIVIKPKIGAWGLNWQHCSNLTVFPSHSYEQYYQLIRRFWRFGQTSEVTAHVIVSEGERGILKNLDRKKRQADEMFRRLVSHMKDSLHLQTKDSFPIQEELPSWV